MTLRPIDSFDEDMRFLLRCGRWLAYALVAGGVVLGWFLRMALGG